MNIWDDNWGEQQEDWSGGGGKAKRLVGSGPRLGASLYELERGNFMIFHFHHGSEELLIVLRGRPTLRTLEGERQLEEGEAVHFPPGPEGAHEIRNDTDETVRYVVAGTRVSPEVVEYPDLKQLTAQSRHDSMTGQRLFVIHDVKEDT
ncbi:MAG: cupin domain-containing protein [Actinomycetota bacterium]